MSATALKYVTPQEYLQAEVEADEKHEYFDGHVVAMAGARVAHNRIVANVIGELHRLLKGKTCDVFPSDLRISTPSYNSYMYPDASIVSGEVEKKDGQFDTCTNPTVIVEVMSESTRDNDRGFKFFYYQQIPSIREYILIDSVGYFAQAIRKQQYDLWQFENITNLDAAIKINSIGLSLSLTDVYYKVSLQ